MRDMTLAALFAFAVLQTAPTPPIVASPAPTAQPAPPVAGAGTGAVAPDPAPDPAKVAADLADLYDKSCGGRIYGTYADACNGLAAQLRQAQAAARKAERAKR